MSPAQVTALLADLVDAYKACNPHGAGRLDEDTRVLYVEELHDIDYEDAKSAVREHIRESKFFPAVAEIRSRVLERRSGLPEPELAWAEVEVALRKGRDRKPVFFNAATEATVYALGWVRLCNAPESSLPTSRAHFYRTYEVLRKRIHAAIEDGRITLGAAGARQEALRISGVVKPEDVAAFVDHAEDPKLPPGVAEMRTVTGRVLARIDVTEGE